MKSERERERKGIDKNICTNMRKGKCEAFPPINHVKKENKIYNNK